MKRRLKVQTFPVLSERNSAIASMNLYQRMWGERGYGRRWAKIQACNASENRKLAALARLWNRMAQA